MRAVIGGGHFLHDLEGAVGRAIIRQDDLQRLVGLREGALDGLADEAFLIVGDDRESHQRAVCRVGHDLSFAGPSRIS